MAVRLISPTRGPLSLEQVVANIRRYIEEAPQATYKLVIGTDSQTDADKTVFVTAIIVQRVGRGARFFYARQVVPPIVDLRHRIYRETEISLRTLEALQRAGLSAIGADFPIEIHLDVGQQGETRMIIQEVVGWVQAVGYTAKIKPDAYGASAVADRFTK
ncbi:ribonuclease H-like YkuK family protein [Calditerricola satsumensis]|uniref:ribonuclease H-like YkuK family protein n=1 Tax=Calditerricola satsumensis TaxID=373054 RepID=UPI0027E4E9A5|nr:ribonuclease H-like YkuK family protein [Calditerricola satsumensis]